LNKSVTINRSVLLAWFLWAIAIITLLGAGFLAWMRFSPNSAQVINKPASRPAGEEPVPIDENLTIPDFDRLSHIGSIQRAAKIQTKIPERENVKAIFHLVEFNDSLFGLADNFGLEPESILWSNYDLLQDNPHSLRPGMQLVIPPIDGILYEWQVGDSVEMVAEELKTEPDKIINWIGNDLDLLNPEIEAGDLVMVPDGQREFQQWILPTIARGAAGVSAGIYGGGACIGPFEGLYGGGGFIWPTVGHTLSGNDYWSGHLAIDIGLVIGEPIYASDSGVIVFSGWATGGYGNVVVIDHGTGYQTLYAHLSGVAVGCGQSVIQGQTIGYGGNTGNSTGAHLHFEVRYLGGFVNPWFVLPPP
jgi:murein DD-endopeptidase MepM/ murein hydrolase activator NlpD